MAKFLMDIESYKTRFTGGHRQYLFFVLLQLKGGGGTSKSTGLNSMIEAIGATYGLGAAKDYWPYLVKASSLPATEIQEKSIPMQHFNYKMPGDRVYGDWNVTFNLDNKGDLLKELHAWQEKIHAIGAGGKFEGTILNVGNGERANKQTVFLVDYQGNTFCSYEIYGAWPKSIGNVILDYQSNEVATVDVTFSYNYHRYKSEVGPGVAGLVKQGVNTLLGAFL